MNCQEAAEILQDTTLKWNYKAEHGEYPKIIFEDTDDEIIFTEKGAFYRYKTHDNCSECGSPTNWETKTEKITKKDLKEMVEE